MIDIIPDGIDPVVGYRSWGFDGNRLISSFNNQPWEPGEAFKALCGNAHWAWEAVEGGGESLEEIAKNMQPVAGYTIASSATSFSTVLNPFRIQQPNYPTFMPNVTLPDGWGYVGRLVGHDAPREGCHCGVYAAVDMARRPPNTVWGELYMWGKVIKGTFAHRSEFAYPKALVTTSPDVAEKLGKYGVPIELEVPRSYEHNLMPFTASVTTAISGNQLWYGSHTRTLQEEEEKANNGGFISYVWNNMWNQWKP